MNKLYAFGDSNIAGHELGHNISEKGIQDFFKKFKVSSLIEAKQKYSDDYYYSNIQPAWYKYCKNSIRPDLSFAATLAKKLNLEHVNYAEPGASNIGQSLKFIEIADIIDWDNDIVLFGVANQWRWNSNDGCKSYQVISKSEQKTMTKIGMGFDSYSITHASVLTYLKVYYPKIQFVKMDDDLAFYNELRIGKILPFDMSLFVNTDAFKKKYGLENMNPGMHPNQHAHNMFADYLLKLLTTHQKNVSIIK